MAFELERENTDYLPVIKVIGVGGGGGNAINRMVKMEVRNVEFIELDYFKVLKTNNKVEVYDKTAEIQFDEYAFSNDYGKVSILILLGSLFVTLGVIITIVNILGGI